MTLGEDLQEAQEALEKIYRIVLYDDMKTETRVRLVRELLQEFYGEEEEEEDDDA